MPDYPAFNALAVSTDALIGDTQAPYALIYIGQRIIGTIAIDVPIRELHNDSYVVSNNPVQSGVTISDHYFRAPPKLEMTCGFSDSTAAYVGYVQQVYQAFQDLANSRTPFSVSSGKRNYDSMLIENLDVTTDETSEFALFITVRLQQIIITDTDAGIATNSSQAFPEMTGSEINIGPVSLIPYTGSTAFITAIKAAGG